MQLVLRTHAKIGKSTIFDLALNANIVTNEYIEDEGPTDNVMSDKLIKKVLLVFAGNIGVWRGYKRTCYKCPKLYG